MAIGDTVQAGLMRVDSSPILLAGQAQAKANQAFGDALGGAVEKFYQKKKDKQGREQRERAYREAGLSAEEAKAASGDKELGSLLMNKMNADRNFFLAQQEVLIEKEKEKREADQFDLKKRDYENRFKERERLLSEAKELKESQLKLDQFLTERPKKPTPEFSNLQKQFSLDQIPGTPEFKQKELSDPMGARPPLMASVATDKPNFKMFNVGKSEAVARLPESFQPEGKRVIDAVESGRLTPREGMSLINQIQAQAIAKQKAAYSPTDLKALRELEKPNLNPGEVEIDKLVAKEYSEFVNMGGQAAVNSKIKKLDDAIDELEKDGDLTGWIKGSLPESLKALFNSKGLSTKEAVESVIQENLRETLGAQFAQREGEMFMARGYNDKLGDEENAKRVKALLKEIKDRAKARNQSFAYFKENGTMKGYNGPSFETVESQSPDTIDPSAPASQATLDELEKKRQLRNNRIMMQQTLDNPNIPNYGPQ